MKKNKISLIVCVADDIRIKNLLESINNNCEVIVVLNDATLEVKKIVKKFENNQKFCLKIIEIPDRNLSKARNVGIKNANNDKVIYYDSDCWVVKNAIEIYEDMLDRYLLVDGKVLFKKDHFQSKIISIMREMGIPGYALCPSIGINKKIIKDIGYYFDDDIKWIEDSELNNRAKKAKIKVGVIDEITCIHDNLTFKKDLKSAWRYGTGVKIASKKGLHKKRPNANWNLIIPCFRKNIFSGIYSIIWNFVYCFGYFQKK